MASEKELEISCIYARVSAAIYAIDAEWNEDTKSLSSSTWKRRRFANLAGRCAWWVYFTFAIYRFLTTFVLKSHKVDVSLQMLYMFTTITYYLACSTMTALGLGGSKFVLLFNQLTHLGREIGKSSAVNTRREKVFTYAHYFYQTVAWSISVLIAAIEGHYMWVLTSSISCPVLYAILVVYLYAMAICFFGLLPTYVFLYFAIVKRTLRGWNDSGVDSDDLNKKVLEYRWLTILCNNFNATFCRFIVPIHKLGFCILFMVSLSISILMNDKESLELFIICRTLFLAALYCLLVLALTAQMMSELWSLSTASIYNFKHQQRRMDDNNRARKLVRSYARSFPPLRFSVGNFYYMEQEAKMTLAGLLMKGTADILIAFKSIK